MVKGKLTLSVICTSFSMERLEDIYELLEAIKGQSYPNIEIIFVAERSRDLFDYVRRYAAEKAIPGVRVIFNEGEAGMSAARNLGIANAGGDIIAFIDDDAIPENNWAEEIVKTFNDESVAAVTGPAVPLFEDESISWYPREFYWIIGCTAWCNWDEPRDVRNIWGMNMAFRREAFTAAGVFSTDIGAIQGRRLHGEEDELSLRIKEKTGKRILFNPLVRVSHKVYRHRLKAKYVARSSYWIGYTRRVLSSLHDRNTSGENLLAVEQSLLGRIFIQFFPAALADIFRHPVIAWRKLSLASVSLSFVALGYMTAFIHGLGEGKRQNPSQEEVKA